MKEQIIVSLTTWSARIGNIPAVLDTILSQSMPPDKIVLNLAYGEKIPKEVQDYIDKNDIEVYYTEDTKVYKKLIPTLLRYPEACVISIDDDWLYPKGMIEDFMNTHARYPNNPISGNSVFFNGMSCHCGCASLTKAVFFGDYIHEIVPKFSFKCPSDDIVYTYFSLLSGHAYVRTENEYFTNLKGYKADSSYSDDIFKDTDIIAESYRYLVSQHGDIPISKSIFSLVSDKYVAKEIVDLVNDRVDTERMKQKIASEALIRSSKAYRIGHILIAPVRKLNNFLIRDCKE